MAELPGQLSLWHEDPAADRAEADATDAHGSERSADTAPTVDAAAPATSPATDDRLAGLPDRDARLRIRTALDENMLVEAGAGAGKTTEMVERMLMLVWSGAATVDGLAAVTFTRKAAAELRQRFQTRLEVAYRATLESGDMESARRLDAALRDIDRAFAGTIHSFCARLLRERPIDAGLDPAFRELQGAEERQLTREFWFSFLDRLAGEGDPQLVGLQRVGLEPGQLFDLFRTIVEQPDVDFPLDDASRPAAGPVRRRLEQWHDEARRLMPGDEPAESWDDLQVVVRQLSFHRFVLEWDDDIDFLSMLCELSTSAKPVQKRWSADANERREVGELGREYKALMQPDGMVGAARNAWLAHRYPIAMRFALRAADEFRVYRQREGLLTFQDLLMLAARLLRTRPLVRRELAERYRYLLIDEFQDTDPVQAEVVLLLAAGDQVEQHDGIADWTCATPRPGALFVVGDPKQSIYRFRRADIAIYNQVKERLAEQGSVIELTTNFRSVPSIATFVNTTFVKLLPPAADALQARFTAMNPHRPDGTGGVHEYTLDDDGERGADGLKAEDPELLASWIAERVERGERQPGDFLVLGRANKVLGAYASALEARGVAVQVSGGGVGIEQEVDELLILLGALEDPGDPTRTLAALVGLFFGLDYGQIAEYVLGPADVPLERRRPLELLGWIPEDTSLRTDGEFAVAAALRRMRGWWSLLREEPADVAIGRIVDELGLLPHAAAGRLGETRAGAVLFLLDTLRVAATRGDASLTSAVRALEAAFEDDEGEAPLRPGRTDVVRIMTLHKAKGLEAPVVVLAAPFGEWNPPIDRCILRGDDGRARGWLHITERKGHRLTVHAAPSDWSEHEARERAADDAERIRLLYVAATRAKDELVIARGPESKRKVSPWSLLDPFIDQHATTLRPTISPPHPRPEMGIDAETLSARIEAVDDRRRRLAAAGYRAAPVKLRAGEVSDYEARAGRGRAQRGRGVDWGSAVHGALEAGARGRSGRALREHCRDLLIAHERPVDALGEPEELDELVAIVEGVLASALWQRVGAADVVQIEVPFGLALDRVDYDRLAATVGVEPEPAADGERPAQEVIEGIIDLAFREADGWVLVDYKSDESGSRIDDARRAKYRAQLEIYADAWRRISGEPVREKILLFTADGASDVW